MSHLESFYRHNELFATHEKVEADGNLRITVVQSECKTELTYHVVECILHDKKRQSANNASNTVCAG